MGNHVVNQAFRPEVTCFQRDAGNGLVFLDTVEVIGSIPVAPILHLIQSVIEITGCKKGPKKAVYHPSVINVRKDSPNDLTVRLHQCGVPLAMRL